MIFETIMEIIFIIIMVAYIFLITIIAFKQFIKLHELTEAISIAFANESNPENKDNS